MGPGWRSDVLADVEGRVCLGRWKALGASRKAIKSILGSLIIIRLDMLTKCLGKL